MSLESIPRDLRGLRACLVCSLIKSFDQFEKEGCENCEEFLRMKNSHDNVYDCTSNNFDGMISVMCPDDSWVAKWQRITPVMCPYMTIDQCNGCVSTSIARRLSRGVYAISVSGTLPKSIIKDLKSRGINYKSRDTSQR